MTTEDTPTTGIANIISPDDVEKIAEEAIKGTYKKACEYLLHDFYDACGHYLHEHFSNFESDIWKQVSDQLIRGYSQGKWSKYNHKELRETLFREHKDEIIKQLDQDLVEEVARLKEALEREKEFNRMRF